MDCIVHGVAESDTTERLSLTHLLFLVCSISPAATAFLYNPSFYQIAPLSVVITPSNPTLDLRVNRWPQIFVLNNTISSLCPSSISHWRGSLHPVVAISSGFIMFSYFFFFFWLLFVCLLAYFVLFHFSLQACDDSTF